MLYKENYKIVIIMRFLLHQSIVSKMFLVDALLNIKYLLEPYRPVYIILLFLWKEAAVFINWGIRDT
jgi:hypothetical protein